MHSTYLVRSYIWEEDEMMALKTQIFVNPPFKGRFFKFSLIPVSKST